MTSDQAMPEHGDRRTFVADGHDEAASIQSDRWKTPSGQILREGRSYEQEWRLRFRIMRIRYAPEEILTLSLRGGWDVVSEAVEIDQLLDDYKEQTLVCSVSSHMRRAPAYHELVEIGEPVVPFALRRLERRGEGGMSMILLLTDITGEQPIREGVVYEDGFAKFTVRECEREWLTWGRDKGLIN